MSSHHRDMYKTHSRGHSRREDKNYREDRKSYRNRHHDDRPSTSRSYVRWDDPQERQRGDRRSSQYSPKHEDKPKIEEINDQIRMNAFRFNVDQSPEVIYTYELIFVIYESKMLDKKPENYKSRTNAEAHTAGDLYLGYTDIGDGTFHVGSDMSAGPMDVVRTQKRMALVFALFRHLVKSHGEVFPGSKYGYAFDAKNTLYSPVVLKFPNQESQSAIYNFTVRYLPENVLDMMDGVDRESIISAFLRKKQKTINLKDFGSESSPVHGVEEFLKTLTWQHAYEKMHNYVVYKDRNFVMDSAQKLKHTRGFKSVVGFAKTVELVPNYCSMSSLLERPVYPIMRMVPKFELFYNARKSQPLLSFAAIFFEISLEELHKELQNPEKVAQLNHVLRNAIVRTTHRDEGRQETFMVDHIDKRSAHEIRVDDEESVAEYLNNEYRRVGGWEVVDRDDHMPCVARKFRSEFAYYPLCTLTLLPNQKVTSRSLPTIVRDSFQEACRNLPKDVVTNMTQAMKDLNLSRVSSGSSSSRDRVVQFSNRYLESFKITIESNHMVEIPVYRFKEPVIEHTRNSFEAKDGMWSHHKNAGLVNPGMRDGGKLGILNTTSWVKDSEMGAFMMKVTGWLKSRTRDRLDFTKRGRVITFGKDYMGHTKFGKGKKISEMVAEAENVLRSFNIRHLIVICSSSKDDKTHDVWKLAERTNDRSKRENALVTTQCISPETLRSVIVRHNTHFDEITSSIIMKMNLKFGGTNYSVQPDMSTPSVSSSNLFIGIDLKEPEKSLANGEPSYSPRVVGFTSSTGSEHFKLRGSYWYQTGKEIDMERLRAHFQDAIERFGDGNRLPSCIVVYWGKTREGRKEMTSEVGVLQAVVDKIALDRNLDTAKPKLVVIAVDTKPPTRFFNWDTALTGSASHQNVKAGFYVKESFVNREFTMVNHKSSAGLSQPVLFSVHCASEQDMCELELEKLTNALCYLQNTSHKATSVPTPLYSAMELTKLGMRNFELIDEINREDETERAREKKRRNTEEQWQQYYTKLLRFEMSLPRDGRFW